MATIQRSIDWHYTPEAWDTFVEVLRLRYAEQRRSLRLSEIWLVVTCFFIAATWALLKHAGGGRTYAIIGVVCSMIWILIQWNRSSHDERQLAQVRGIPRVVIDAHGMHVGGVYTPWGVQSLSLRRISILAVSPILLQFDVGSYKMYHDRYRLRFPAIAPVPVGKEGEARQLMEELGFSWEMALPTLAQDGGKGARRWSWWRIAAATALLGGFLFFLEFKLDGASAHPLTPIGLALVMTAFLSWIMSGIAAMCAIVLFVKASWRGRRAG